MAEKSDPTRSGFSAPKMGPVQLSGGEVKDLCLRAARGAGLSWGLAEEAGFAARWLHERGLDGTRALLEHLEAGGASWPSAKLENGALLATGTERLSPIVFGAALSDLATVTRDSLRANPIHQPVLLLPFLHLAAGTIDKNGTLAWEHRRVTVSSSGRLTGAVEKLAASETADVSVSFSESVSGPDFKPSLPSALAHETITRLNALAMETTVPATDTSRADAG